jgi:pimeloyl-ACP methyl ester carboxylesterase
MSRPIILLLHAFPLDARMWTAQQRALEDAGYEVVAPDLPGAEPEIGFGPWAERVLGGVEGDFIPVGISMGGYLTFELWRRARTRIPALVLADTRASADTPEQRQARDDTIRLLGEAGFEPFWEGLAPKLFSAAADPGVVAQARALAAEQPITSLVASLMTLRDREDSTPTLPTIDVPTLVVVGEEDALTPPSDAAELEDGIRQARLVRMPGAGHLTPLERPEEFNRAFLSFLDEAAPGIP